MSEDTTLDLAIIRNRLLAGKADARDDSLLREVAMVVRKQNPGSPYPAILLWAIENALSDVRAGNLERAALELDLAHNIPTFWEKPLSWDEELFLKGSVVDYIEAAPIDRIKALFSLLGTGYPTMG